MVTTMEERTYETTLRMGGELGDELNAASLVMQRSKNALIVQAIEEAIERWQKRPEYQRANKELIARLGG